jgi:hypothetical protein
METLNLEQEPLQPTPLEPQLVKLFKLARSIDLGIQSELRTLNEV